MKVPRRFESNGRERGLLATCPHAGRACRAKWIMTFHTEGEMSSTISVRGFLVSPTLLSPSGSELPYMLGGWTSDTAHCFSGILSPH